MSTQVKNERKMMGMGNLVPSDRSPFSVGSCLFIFSTISVPTLYLSGCSYILFRFLNSLLVMF